MAKTLSHATLIATSTIATSTIATPLAPAALTQIRGIGVTRQRWLQSLQIKTMEDLANASVDELKTALKNAGYAVPHQDLKNWIAQAQVIVAESAQESHQRSQPTMSVAIPTLRLLQAGWTTPLVVDRTRCFFAQALNAGQPFALEATLQFTDHASDSLKPSQIIYCAQCTVRHLMSGVTSQIGEAIANVPIGGQATYSVIFPELLLLEPGAYRLMVTVTVQHPIATPGYFRVPLLQVVDVRRLS